VSICIAFFWEHFIGSMFRICTTKTIRWCQNSDTHTCNFSQQPHTYLNKISICHRIIMHNFHADSSFIKKLQSCCVLTSYFKELLSTPFGGKHFLAKLLTIHQCSNFETRGMLLVDKTNKVNWLKF